MASTIKVDKIEGSTGSTITVPTGQTLTVTDGIPVASGGTGLASFTAGDILYATGATTLVKLAKGTGRQGLQTNSGATAPEWTDSPQSLMTAAGDILYASGANTLAKLAKGSDDEVLTLASGVPSWAESAGGGKVGQVVYATEPDAQSVASASYVDMSGMTITITPTATSSKVMLLGSAMISNHNQYSYFKFVYGDGSDLTTQAIGDTRGSRVRSYSGSLYSAKPDGQAMMTGTPIVLLDAPNTTSATTYKMQARNSTGTNAIYLNRTNTDSDDVSNMSAISTLIAMEILA